MHASQRAGAAVRLGESWHNYPVALIHVPTAGVPELAYIQPEHLGAPRVVIDPVRDVIIWEWSSKNEIFGDQVPDNDPNADGVVFDLALRCWFPSTEVDPASSQWSTIRPYSSVLEYGGTSLRTHGYRNDCFG